MKQEEAGAKTGGNGTARGTGAASGGGGGRGAAAPSTQASQSSQAAAATTQNAASRNGQKLIQRTTGLVIRKPSHRKISGKVTELRGVELDDYLGFCTEVEGVAPDMDDVLENALAALFARAKGFSSWRKNRSQEDVLDIQVEDVARAVDSVLQIPPATGAVAGSGAPT